MFHQKDSSSENYLKISRTKTRNRILQKEDDTNYYGYFPWNETDTYFD